MPKRNLETKITQLLEKSHLLTAGEIITQLLESGQKYNKTSIYRALDRLQAADEICQYFFRNNEAVYELRSHDHSHFVCENCNQIFELPTLLKQNIQLDVGTADHHHLTMFGICTECETQTS